jgi:predicted Zn-dependent peptidase
MQKPPIKEFNQGFKFPDFKIEHINDKIDLVIYQDKTQLLAGISVIFSQGAETDSIPGLAFFTSQMLKRGTQTRSSEQIAEDVDMLGSIFSCGMNWDYTPISIVSITKNIKQSIDLLFDSILNPTFSKDEIKRFKRKHSADIGQELADPSYLCNISLNNNLYANHPYGHPLIGTKDSIKSITREDCISFHQKILESEKIYIVVAGNFSKNIIKNYMMQKIELLSNITKKIRIQKVKPTKGNQIFITNKSSIKQTILRVAKHSISRDNPDFAAIQFINTVYGGFFMSRLNELLREKLGYTYGVHSFIQLRKYGSAHILSTSIKQKSTQDTMKHIFEQMNQMSSKEISDEEFHLA